MRRIPIRIVYEDHSIIVVEKDEGLLSVGTARGKEEITAHSMLNNYVRNTAGRGWNRHSAPRVYIVHRLDRETSGLMVFAKSEEAKRIMQENWDSIVTERKYVAVTNGMPFGENEEGSLPQGCFRSWLKENSAYVVYSSPKDNGGQLAITNYKTLEYNPKKNKSLIELELETGRKNQIRVHMQEMGCPIWGDKKYFGGNEAILQENKKAGRLFLHAFTLNFHHPITGKLMKFTTGIPNRFKSALFRDNKKSDHK